MEHTQITGEIRDFLAGQSEWGGLRSVSDTDSLLEAGIIDSVSMVQLVAHLARTYDISVDEDDMTPENFETIEAMAKLVISKYTGD